MRLKSLTVAIAVVAASGGVALGAASPAAADVQLAPPARYVPVAPVRALDTRTTSGPLGQSQVLAVDLSTILPAESVTAVVLNVTAVDPTAAGYLTVYADGTRRPTASSLNKRAGETRSNSVTVALTEADSRIVDVFNQAGTTQLVVDVVGYYGIGSDAADGADYVGASAPFRVLDTRTGARLGNDSVVDVRIDDPGTVTGVTAVAVNLTAVAPTGPGYVTAWNGADPQPTVSSLNYGTDPVTPNFTVVPVEQDSDGLHFTVENHVAGTDLLIDVAGFYAAPTKGGAAYVPVDPTRIADTRTSGGALVGNETRDLDVPVTDLGQYDLDVDSVNANVTAVDASAPTFLTVFGAGSARASGSNLNPFTAAALANAVQTAVTPDPTTTPADPAYRYSVYNSQGSVDVVVDLEGYFVLDPQVDDNARVSLPVPGSSVTRR